ncbi:NAD dependent epimerase/dehydratase family protein [Boeremia exigua]|uniref:NAD dependent epimerase/dehydratase family protein n=1 Tax=Boeremia exigua TaxID=749465 RepID=UPI001E8E3BB4|nr:NAD dependent epimerase/dehydratase family protein [Boeremia exigua]KAH6613890.1 NAD dependent epimerase/dehydratase family protein [Boeremia exigua]
MGNADVLVTGAAGHLGCALMLSLPSYGYTPIGIDTLDSPTTTLVGSISNRTFVESLFAAYPNIRHILHAATLHKPHVDSHSKSDFVDVNITGTLILLETAAGLQSDRIDSFIFVSTTSVFGQALSPKPGSPAVWIDETVTPIPKNIYGVTKAAAEDMCRLTNMQTSLPVLVLRTSRFFPEADDDEDRRAALGDENLKCLELAYRRTDIADVVSACVHGMKRARDIGWGKYIISAPPPFPNDADTLRRLDSDAGGVYRDSIPGIQEAFSKHEWKFLPRLDRVYDSGKAVRELGWQPVYTIQHAVERLAKGEEWRSKLTFEVGKKGYHAVSTGVYTAR